ncbi:putative nonaspanin (TM9SF) [Helianthus anomalus]
MNYLFKLQQDFMSSSFLQNVSLQFEMGRDARSEIVCLMTLNETTIKEFKEKIDDGYRANICEREYIFDGILDHLPLVVPVTTNDNDSEPIYQPGYLVGYKTKDEKYFTNNHLSFIVRYHQNSITPARRIVGFEAEAFRYSCQI